MSCIVPQQICWQGVTLPCNHNLCKKNKSCWWVMSDKLSNRFSQDEVRYIRLHITAHSSQLYLLNWENPVSSSSLKVHNKWLWLSFLKNPLLMALFQPIRLELARSLKCLFPLFSINQTKRWSEDETTVRSLIHMYDYNIIHSKWIIPDTAIHHEVMSVLYVYCKSSP